MTAGSEQVLAPLATEVTSPTSDAAERTGARLLAVFPPRPLTASWPATEESRAEVVARVLAPPFVLDNRLSQQTRRMGVLAVLSWLATHPGDSWQQRWQASGAEDQPDWRDAITAAAAGRRRGAAAAGARLPHLSPGLLVLICADVLRPSLGWLLRFAPARRGLATEMARTRDSLAFAALAELCTQGRVGLQAGQQALTRIAVMVASKGGAVDQVRVGDCVQLLQSAAELRATSGSEAHAHSPLFYQLLRTRGVLGEDAPATMEMFSGRGQPSCEQLIDRYQIACRPVRDVLVDYLRERQPSVDFSSLQRLAYLLGKLFWADLEAHHPDIDSLKLPREVAAGWKQRVMTRTRTATSPSGEQVTLTSTRLDGRGVLSAVRAFYLDIAEWADDDPARWGPWAVRCPVSASDVSHKKDRSRRKSRMDARTRERLPVLPVLVSWVEAERARTAELFAAADAAPPGELFTAAGQTLRRAVMRTETTGRVWAEPADGGQRRDLSFEEHRGFWTWAMVQVLRTTGVRIEELTELSHHSLIQYRLPDSGQLIPLLQITPSKTDAERLLVISPELADVLSTIVARIRAGQPHVPLVVSYDKNERVYNPPMPLLFQWRRRLENRPVSETVLRGYLDHALTALGVKDTAGRPMRYTFHDFRRMFITDAIMHGMPPHIAQLVAGHRDINTTLGYKAVYPDEVINGHRAFIARRRALRPSEEYRTPTDEEWDQFIGHFEHRKVSVGDCGRSYYTPCIHEHSCLRCPLLRPDPAARPCNASDFVRHLLREKPSHGSVRLIAREVGAGVRYQRVQQEEAAAVAAEREVRAVGLGVDWAEHPARGRGEVQGRPVHGAAHLQGRQAGRLGRPGGVGAWPSGTDRGGGRVGGGPGGDRTAPCHGYRAGGGVASARGKSALGLSAGPVPARVDGRVKAGLLDLVDQATGAGWSRRRAGSLLGLDLDRVTRWQDRRRAGRLDDDPPGGSPVHGLLDWERTAIVELFEAWGDLDRSHRKLAHRGSRLDLVHVSESTVRRVLAAEGLVLQGNPAREPTPKTPWPDWLEWKPNRVWAYDFTHFTRARRAVVAVLDMVSRKWLATVCSAEETSTQVEVAFIAALDAEGLLDDIDARDSAALRAALASGDRDAVEAVVADGELPLLLAVSDNGPQMRSHSTREFLAGVHIAQHFGRPHTPTDQAWIETLFGHVKGEWPHLEKITDPGELELELDRRRTEYNSVRLHAAIGYVTPDDEHEGRGEAIRQARLRGLAAAREARIDYRRNQTEDQP